MRKSSTLPLVHVLLPSSSADITMDSILSALVSILLATLIFIIIPSIINKQRKQKKQKFHLPPGPINWPVLGSLHRIGALPHVSLVELSKKYGDIFYLKLGTVPYVVLSSPELVKEAYAKYPLELAAKAPNIAGEHGGMNFSGIVMQDYTPQLRLYRKLLNMHLLSAARLKSYEALRKQELTAMMSSVFQQAKLQNPVKIKAELHAMNMNVVTYMLFGERYFGSTMSKGIDAQEFVDLVNQALRLIVAPNISDYIPQIRWMDLNGVEKRYKSFMPRMKQHLMSILENRKRVVAGSKISEPRPFIDILIEEDEEISDISKISIIFDVITATVESTATALEWTLAELLRNPEMLVQAQLEIQSATGNNSRWVEESDLPNLKFIEAIIKENLRLRPPGPLPVPRICKTSINLGGYDIPKGTIALVNFYALGVNDKHWKDPLDFKPQRFLDSDVDVTGTDYTVLPFGTGRRVCPGARLAMDTMKMNLAALLQGFDWSLLDSKPLNMDPMYSTVLAMAEELEVAVQPRMPAEWYKP